jgi:PAS domain S-box-containing protein
MNILLLENEPAHAEAIRRALEASDLKAAVHVAGTLREYHEAVAVCPPDIALLDMVLPDGRALDALTSLPDARHFPVLIMTSYGNEQMAVEAMKAGAQDYIVKSPEAFATMPHAVERALREWNGCQERKRAEEMLRESEIRYRTLFQASPDGILIADLETKSFGYANPAICRMLGYSVTELTTMGVAAIHPKVDLPRVMAEFEAQSRGDKTLAADLPCLRKDGTIVYADVVAGAVTIEGRACNVGFFRDITERKRAEEKLRASEENYRRSLEDSPLGVCIVTAAGDTLFANKTILDLYGFDSLGELNKTPLKNRHTPQSYADFQDRKKQRLNGTFPSGYEISIVRKNGEVRVLQVLRKEVLWDGANADQVLYLDITARKTAEERLNETLQHLRVAMASTIQVLGLTVEARDPYTAGHQHRTTVLAEAIGREMGLPPEKIEGLHLAGLVHDAGKISIPAEILSKPTKLTPGEYALVKTHAQRGYEILKDVVFPWPLAEIVRQHHERMDGSGYPRGLKGEEILMEARILSVSDTVEAMVSDRPYRPAQGVQMALAEVEKNKGTFYDAVVAETCLKLFRGKGFSFPA